MGASSFSKHDLEMIEISWSFTKNKHLLGLNTMIRIFESSQEIKTMFGFGKSLDNLELDSQMIDNHVSQVIKKLDDIIILLTRSLSISDNDKKELSELGQLHYHFGLKIEHFKVNFLIKNKKSINLLAS